MYDLLFAHQRALELQDLLRYAEELALDSDDFRRDLRKQKFAARVAEDVESADLSRVSGTPTFFINGRRRYGAYDIATLTATVRAARGRCVAARHFGPGESPHPTDLTGWQPYRGRVCWLFAAE